MVFTGVVVYYISFNILCYQNPDSSFLFSDFPIHLYPLIFTFCFSFSLVSVKSAIWIFSDSSRDSRLFIFPFSPFTLIVAIVRFLFFLILFSFMSFLVCSALCRFNLFHSLYPQLFVICTVLEILLLIYVDFCCFSWSWNVCIGVVPNAN